jgi:hypothetical protein
MIAVVLLSLAAAALAGECFKVVGELTKAKVFFLRSLRFLFRSHAASLFALRANVFWFSFF